MGRPSAVGFAIVVTVVVGGGWRVRANNPDPARCGSCHAAETAVWQGSRHAVAATNRTFAVAFARSDRHPWCTTCHQADGVGCAACHSVEGSLVAVDPTLRARLVHPITAEPRLADERLCATCHQFTFPETGALADAHPTAFTDTPTQDTVAEWRVSAAAREGRTCVDCHDPHSAPGAHDPAFVRDVLSVDATYDGAVARFTVTADGAAHAVPTGDPFRRLVLSVDDGPEVVLERTFTRGARGLVERADRRIPPATTGSSASVTVELVAPSASRWRLTYAYADPMHEPALPPDEVHLVVAAGSLVEEP